MVAVSGALMFLGYQLMAYGWSQVRGDNAGFFDILWPGRFKGSSLDSGGGITYTPGKGLSDVGAGGTIGATSKLGARQQSMVNSSKKTLGIG